MSDTPPEGTPPPADTPPPPPPPHTEHHEPPKGDGIEGALTALTTTVQELANLIKSQQPVKPDSTPVKRPWTHPAPRREA